MRQSLSLVPAKAERWVDMAEISEDLAGAEGFEPSHGGTKNRCLTAWLRPSRGALYSV